MSFNPFEEKSLKVDKYFKSRNKVYPKAYNKFETDPYTKVRIILATGAEFEAVWFSHQFSRHCGNNDLRREIAVSRRIEQQQQKMLSYLKPIDENPLETTIAYEQLAVDLTANLAQAEPNLYIKKALDFALLEDFDHLYRFSDLLEMEQGVKGEQLVGQYTEIMPGRPTISEHRYPYDDIRRAIKNEKSDPLTRLHASIITAAEQQTMNFYMNLGTYHSSEIGRKLFLEIAMIEEQHVSQYGSLMDTSCTWLEGLLEHEYTECYLYYSLMNDETDDYIRGIWESHLNMEISHLHKAAELLKTYENKQWQQVIPNGEFPALLAFNGNATRNKEYVRKVLANTVYNTAILEDYVKVDDLPENYEFFKYNNLVNHNANVVASHNTIEQYIAEFGVDYRFQEKEHPVKPLRDRKSDNTEVGR